MGIGMTVLTFVHVVVSLVGIFSGIVVVGGLLSANRLDRWNALFLAATVAASATGFCFPVDRFLPSHAVGTISLLILPVAIFARYGRQMQGPWRLTYVVAALSALYLNVFVLIEQLFLKVPALYVLAPTQSEPPFLAAQLAVLALIVVLSVFSAIRFRANAPASTLFPVGHVPDVPVHSAS